MKATYRQCMTIANTAEELKGRGSFAFRCAVAAIVIEATRHVEIFNDARKPAKGMQAFQEEVGLIRENNTIEKNGKKEVNVSVFMPLLQKAKAAHKPAIEAAEKLQAEANKDLDKEVDISAKAIAISLLEETDKDEHFEVSILSRLLPFVEK